jgi:hypothetical protein
VPLGAVCCGGRWYVSESAIARFVAGVTWAKVGTATSAAPASESNQRRAEQVARQLDELGI